MKGEIRTERRQRTKVCQRSDTVNFVQLFIEAGVFFLCVVSGSRSARYLKLFWAQKWPVPLSLLHRDRVEWAAVVDMSTSRAIVVSPVKNRTSDT